ncbi:MAG: SUMF1/EgtB/PvdO family nonheme iron enzyme [bacterium]|nr:SUMF1/EgtB/PvdO family nonheme iron enzyme [bacterium]
MFHSTILFLPLFLSSYASAGSVPQDAGTWSPPSSLTSLTSLPSVPRLPDLFTLADGRRVETREDWDRRRQELKAIIQYYQYGHVPPRPDRVIAVESSRRPHESGLGTLESVTLEVDSVKKLRFRAVLYLPKHEGRRPVIIRDEGNLGHRREAPMFLEKGYTFIEYAPHDLDPDRDRVVGAAQAAYPDYDWATLAVWAWCGMRLVDYLETRDDIDLDRIGITGHSRSGKMALLATALDERFSFAAPHQSGSGGAGCYRILSPGAETLAQNDKPHWYHGRIRWFGEQEERLPFDQHFVKALVAPRALLCTESIDDEFANPLGTLVTSAAAQEVFEFLDAPERNGIHFRRGNHSTRPEDWERLLEFAEWHFFNRPPDDREKYWRSPFSLPPEFASERVRRPIGLSIETEDEGEEYVVPPADATEAQFVAVGLPENPPDRDHHGQGQYGAVSVAFEIGARQITHIEYARFLNAVALRDPGSLYHPAMANGPGSIRREQTTSGSRYLVRKDESPTPVTHVDWYDAVRYCNWIHNGRPVGHQDPTTTEDGAYQLTDAGEAGPRKSEARCFLPTEDEWYKSAYYAPASDGKGSYRHFSLLRSDRPVIARPRPEQVSPWGMEGFADRIWEWTETPVGSLHRGLRSGAWFLGNNRQAAGRFYSNPEMEYPSIGFRVARPKGSSEG